MAKTKPNLLETVMHELPPVEGGVLKGAKLLGLTSRNNRRYEAQALESAKALYEGRKVYVDHPDPDDPVKDRSFKDWAGVIENVRFRKGDGLYGDIVLRQESAHFKGIVEAATNPKFRKSCGFSHVADGESHLDGETEIIESIREVFSVDLVTDPATTGGLFESRQSDSTSELRESVEQLPADHAIRTQLVEMLDAGMFGMPNAEQPADPLTTILQQAIAALADSLKALAKANKPAPAVPPAAAPTPEDDSTGDQPPEDEDEDMSDEDREKLAAFESVQRELAEQRAKNLLLESGRESSKARIKALANCATEDEQRELLESWPRIEESTRPARSPALLETLNDFPRDNPEKFAALLR